MRRSRATFARGLLALGALGATLSGCGGGSPSERPATGAIVGYLEIAPPVGPVYRTGGHLVFRHTVRDSSATISDELIEWLHSPVGPSGRFHVAVAPGVWRVGGTSPLYGGGTYPCTGGTVTVRAGQSVRLDVKCNEK